MAAEFEINLSMPRPRDENIKIGDTSFDHKNSLIQG